MLQFFYKTRNILGLILVISPALALLPAGNGFSLSLPFLCAMAVGLPLLCAAFRAMPLRLWTALCAFLLAAGFFLHGPEIFWTENTRESWTAHLSSPLWKSIAAFLSGLGTCGLVLILPPNLAVGWFRRSKTTILGLVWTGSLFLSFLWRQLLYFSPLPAFLAALSFLLTGGLLFLEKPPVDYRHRHNPLTCGRPATYVRPAAYVTILGFSLHLIPALASGPASDPLSPLSIIMTTMTPMTSDGPAAILLLVLPVLAMTLAPLFTARLMEKKGVFSGCVLLIFLCESAILCLGSFTGWGWQLCGRSLYAMALAGLLVIIPVLTVYLYGQADYLESAGRLTFFLPVGFLTAEPFRYLINVGEFPQGDAVIFLLLLLVASFFCIFMAWKRRFVILKNNAA